MKSRNYPSSKKFLIIFFNIQILLATGYSSIFWFGAQQENNLMNIDIPGLNRRLSRPIGGFDPLAVYNETSNERTLAELYDTITVFDFSLALLKKVERPIGVDAIIIPVKYRNIKIYKGIGSFHIMNEHRAQYHCEEQSIRLDLPLKGSDGLISCI